MRRKRSSRKNISVRHRKRSIHIRKRRRSISDVRLERALRVFSKTKNAKVAAQSIRVSVERFERAARRKAAIRKRKGILSAIRRLPRKMPVFTAGRQLAVTANRKNTALIARYMSAVGHFLKTNDPKYLTEFKGRNVKDVKGRIHPFETDPNTLYRLASTGNEPFEEVYRIVI
jgi:hypothetical protein